MKKEKFIDLHTHTIFSDGGLTPNALVMRAKDAGLSAISVTDHDNLLAMDVAILKGAELGVEIVPGIELTAYVDETLDLHILGYFIDKKNRPLNERLEYFKKQREIKSKKVVDNLKELGYKIDYNEVKKIARGTVAAPHLAYVLINNSANSEKLTKEFGELPTTGIFIRDYLAAGGKAYEPREAATPEEAINLIHGAGGLAVLAHPCWNLCAKVGSKLVFDDQWVDRLVKLGLDGIEVWAHRENEKDTEKAVAHYEKLADKYKLIKTGGSDFHGFGSAGKELGFGDFYLKVPYEILENLKSKVKKID
ncbi:MAG TPA: PHP domain-containing protein [Candidatus Saccharimonadales bacterium]|nr:PHP domain-containing protein [Candidatus Saccharimonadales bacterium]